jgi:hypothetical protein
VYNYNVLRCPFLQATFSQLCNFACEYPEDEKLLMDTFKQQNVRSNAITIQPSAAVPVGDSARFRDYGVICTLDEVRGGSRSGLLVLGSALQAWNYVLSVNCKLAMLCSLHLACSCGAQRTGCCVPLQVLGERVGSDVC